MEQVKTTTVITTMMNFLTKNVDNDENNSKDEIIVNK